jgi:catechol 2,3-dioxygenase-like lactoylglutathione lyase family enzyme
MRRVLDHVGVAVADLERGRAAFARLGFTLTSRSLHAGARTPGGPVEPMGSGNHCAMLETGYLEIIGLTDPTRPNSVKDLVARYEGPHIVAIGVDDADAASAELVRLGAPVEAPRALERDAPWGPDERETRRAKFRNLYVDRERFPEARFLFIEHLTRDVLWQPHLLAHPNGVVALEAVYFIADDVRATASKFATLFAPEAIIDSTKKALPLALDRGTIWVTDATSWRARTPGAFAPPAPAPAGFGLRVRSLDASRAYFASKGIAMQPGATGTSTSFWIAPEEACGAAIQFIQD